MQCTDLYSQAHNDIMEMELEMSGLHESAGLFEVNTPDYKQLKACRREVYGVPTLFSPLIP